MKKRLAQILEPANALSQATMPPKLYRSLSKEKKRNRPMKRRTRVCHFVHVIVFQLCWLWFWSSVVEQNYDLPSSPFACLTAIAAFLRLKVLPHCEPFMQPSAM